MDGMLSQDEINALLNGMELPDSGDKQEESTVDTSTATTDSEAEELLSDVEKDAIGEVANISMGTSATTLYSLVNTKVNITTPVVSLTNWEGMMAEYERPCVFIQIRYTVGLDGSNILVLKENDVKIITDLMMGGDGTNVEGELGELHLSAISEAMNQMMGSAATSLSTMLDKTIDISPPQASLVDLPKVNDGGTIASFLDGYFVKVAFRMQIGDLVDSTIMQLYPIDFAKFLCDTFLAQQMGSMEAAAPAPQAAPAQASASAAQPQAAPQMNMGGPQMDMNQQMGMPQMGMPQMGMPQMGMPQMGAPYGMPYGMQPGVNVAPAQFQNFATDFSAINGNENIGLIMDVPLEVTVELGRTTKTISDILDFAPGTIIELDKIAGEPIDVLVNGKFVAKGEVVVIEESFGIRVTEIIK